MEPSTVLMASAVIIGVPMVRARIFPARVSRPERRDESKRQAATENLRTLQDLREDICRRRQERLFVVEKTPLVHPLNLANHARYSRLLAR